MTGWLVGASFYLSFHNPFTISDDASITLNFWATPDTNNLFLSFPSLSFSIAPPFAL